MNKEYMLRQMKPKKLTNSGQSLLTLMRISETNDNDLRNRVWNLYLRKELHEVSAALSRTCPDKARKVVSDIYNDLTECVVFEQDGNTFSTCFTEKELSSDGVKSSACLIAATIILTATNNSVIHAKLNDIAGSVGQLIGSSLTGINGWEIDFPYPAAWWVGGAFPSNMKLHLLFELIGYSKQTQINEIMALEHLHQISHALFEQVKNDPTSGDTPVVMTILGYARQNDVTEKGRAAVMKAVNWKNGLEHRIKEIISTSTNKEFAGTIGTIESINSFSKTYETSQQISRYLHFRKILDVANERAEGEEIEIATTPITLGNPECRFDELSISIWRKSGGFLYGTTWVALQDQVMSDLIGILIKLGIELDVHVTIHPETRRDVIPENKEGISYQSPSGEWYDPHLAVAGAGSTLIKTAQWEYPSMDEVDETRIKSLPFPQREIARGIVESMQTHYIPDVYRRIKELFADITSSDEQVLLELEKSFPAFSELLRNAPFAALPTLMEMCALRWYWSTSPIFVAIPELSERLQLTDLGLDIDASFCVVPYAMFYLHFQDRRNDMAWEDIDGEQLMVSGVYVHQHGPAQAELGNPRILDIAFCAETASGEYNGFIDISLRIEDESESMQHVFQRWAQSEQDSEKDQKWIDFMQFMLDELFKVMVYIGTRDARLEKKMDRTNFLKTAKKNTTVQRNNNANRVRWIYDHILIGPESVVEEITGKGLSGRKVKPHFRRGHRHTVCFGRGREQRRLELYPPVIVNANLIGQGEIVSPKKYIVK